MTIGLPKGWAAVELGEVAVSFVSGGTPSSKVPKFWDGTIPWTTSSSISEDDVVIDHAQRFITTEGLEKSASHLVPCGSLVVGTRVGVGKAVVNLIAIAISQDLTGVVLDSGKIAPLFAAYYFKKSDVQRFIAGRKRGATIKGISRADLTTLTVNLPPLPEQNAIAKALRTVQEAKDARKKEIALERERKAALMEYLFTHGTKGEPRKQTELGEIPQSWDVVKLGDRVEELRYGYTASATSDEVGPRFLRITDIQDRGVEWSQVPFCDCPPKLQELYSLNPGDIVVARIGATTGKAFLLSDCPSAVFASYLIRIRTSRSLRANYLDQYMQSSNYWSHIERNKGGKLKGGINLPILRNLTIPYPTQIGEQDTIASVLSGCDNRMALLKSETDLLDELFRAMLEELMTGRLSAVPLIGKETRA